MSTNNSVEPYQFEPEYDSDELPDIPDEEVAPEASEMHTSRHNKEASCWCQCSNCLKMPIAAECICCTEQAYYSAFCEEYQCITQHPAFNQVCLNKHVLWAAIVGLHDQRNCGHPKKENVTNKNWRYAAYRQFTWWTHGYLGKRIRRAIPACAVKTIRDTFPEANGNYTGFTINTEINNVWHSI